MKIAVHHACRIHEDSYAKRWIEQLQRKNIEVLALDFRATDIIEQIRGCQGTMWHWFHTPDDKMIAPKILQAIEIGLDIPVYPNMPTRWHYDEKVAQHFLFDAIGVPKVRSWVFTSHESAINFIKNCSYPIIFKLSVGAGSANVLKLDSFSQAEKILHKMFTKGIFPYTLNEFSTLAGSRPWRSFLRRFYHAFRYILLKDYPPFPDYYLPQKNYVYFQEFLPGNNYDIRITVIGNRAFGFIRQNRPDDFRASGSGVISYSKQDIPLEAVKIAHKISQEQKFQTMAYDFLFSKQGDLLVNEISYCYLNQAVFQCPGYWDRELNWHEGNLWPEEAQVTDFLYYLKHGELP